MVAGRRPASGVRPPRRRRRRDAVERGTETQLDHASGLGLWLIRWSAEVAGGRVTFADNEPNGAVATVDAPRLD